MTESAAAAAAAETTTQTITESAAGHAVDPSKDSEKPVPTSQNEQNEIAIEGVGAGEEELLPEDEEQALALNIDGLRYWLREVILENNRLEKQLEASKKCRLYAAEVCRSGTVPTQIAPSATQQPQKLPGSGQGRTRLSKAEKKRRNAEAQKLDGSFPAGAKRLKLDHTSLPSNTLVGYGIASQTADGAVPSSQGQIHSAQDVQPVNQAAPAQIQIPTQNDPSASQAGAPVTQPVEQQQTAKVPQTVAPSPVSGGPGKPESAIAEFIQRQLGLL